jgi:hypothetical protein
MEATMQLQPVRNEIIVPTININDRKEEPHEVVNKQKRWKRNPFIEANTREVEMAHLRKECVVPVFSKDNEVTISHPEFIETVWEAANHFFNGETIEDPDIRVSHIVKGRIPEAIHKPVEKLLETDKTQYYETMAFCFEVPTISETIVGSPLNLTIGGVRAYNHENLYSKKGMEKFKVFIGFKNLVCTNMCVSTDGYMSEIRVMNSGDLFVEVIKLFQRYNISRHLYYLSAYKNNILSEHQFAQFIGKTRLYQCLPAWEKKQLPELLMTDSQINIVAKSYYSDEDFGVVGDYKEISMWNVYNLLTGANKSSYIDNFLDRSLNATELTEGLSKALHGDKEYAWFID